MEIIHIIAIVLCLFVGLSLGLLGGGGSVLMVPIFVYVAKVSINEAIAMSLIIVGISSAVGSYKYYRQGFVNQRLVVLFVVPGVIAAFLGARLTQYVSANHLLFMFGILMALIALILFKKSSNRTEGLEQVVCRPGLVLSVVAGAVIGLLTGLLGVGGGFLIVPAIALLMKCSLYTAIGTSLVIISINSLTGFIGHISVIELNVPLTAAFLIATVAGAVLGTRFSDKFSIVLLQRTFAILIFGVGLFLAVQHFPYGHGA
ncbi:MAG: putative membrane protein YfcA [Candidatus Omnitrophota bacterium]|jgi:uncharacterized membrane protein YfcA